MSESIEFSNFFKLLDGIKEGDETNNDLINKIISEYKDPDQPKSFLDELGKRFIHIGFTELYEYSENKDLKYISNINKDKWEELAEKNDLALPQYLANAMITFVREQKMSKEMATKWQVREREINKHVRPMAQYITEGIIDFLE
ncbi:hypothetical protein [Prochlorococcus sp. MIT 1223]|uniref:hypothetical protein n=1 Tax=Prochlorococcus sp. MIT 1223 TaxID=3096217 RepID=UPI002A7666A5|nr:hypothetical protein [Prochlorococcus sp. MIT 1223]